MSITFEDAIALVETTHAHAELKTVLASLPPDVYGMVCAVIWCTHNVRAAAVTPTAFSLSEQQEIIARDALVRGRDPALWGRVKSACQERVQQLLAPVPLPAWSSVWYQPSDTRADPDDFLNMLDAGRELHRCVLRMEHDDVAVGTHTCAVLRFHRHLPPTFTAIVQSHGQWRVVRRNHAAHVPPAASVTLIPIRKNCMSFAHTIVLPFVAVIRAFCLDTESSGVFVAVVHDTETYLWHVHQGGTAANIMALPPVDVPAVVKMAMTSPTTVAFVTREAAYAIDVAAKSARVIFTHAFFRFPIEVDGFMQFAPNAGLFIRDESTTCLLLADGPSPKIAAAPNGLTAVLNDRVLFTQYNKPFDLVMMTSAAHFLPVPRLVPAHGYRTLANLPPRGRVIAGTRAGSFLVIASDTAAGTITCCTIGHHPASTFNARTEWIAAMVRTSQTRQFDKEMATPAGHTAADYATHLREVVSDAKSQLQTLQTRHARIVARIVRLMAQRADAATVKTEQREQGRVEADIARQIEAIKIAESNAVRQERHARGPVEWSWS